MRRLTSLARLPAAGIVVDRQLRRPIFRRRSHLARNVAMRLLVLLARRPGILPIALLRVRRQASRTLRIGVGDRQVAIERLTRQAVRVSPHSISRRPCSGSGRWRGSGSRAWARGDPWRPAARAALAGDRVASRLLADLHAGRRLAGKTDAGAKQHNMPADPPHAPKISRECPSEAYRSDRRSINFCGDRRFDDVGHGHHIFG